MSLPQEPLASILNLILLPILLKISSNFASSSWLFFSATFHFKVNDFPISEIWNKLLSRNQLNGFESLNKFYHLTNFEVFNKLKDL